MFRLLLTIAIYFSQLQAFSQSCTIIKGSAYQRATIPGNIPRRDLDETGKEVEKPVKFMNTFFIYVETPRDCIIEVNTIWIAGKAYYVKQEEIKNTPVIIQHTHPGSVPDTLVKHTQNKVYQIQPAEERKDKSPKKILRKEKNAKIIIEYHHGSRKGSFAFMEVKRIAPMVLQ